MARSHCGAVSLFLWCGLKIIVARSQNFCGAVSGFFVVRSSDYCRAVTGLLWHGLRIIVARS